MTHVYCAQLDDHASSMNIDVVCANTDLSRVEICIQQLFAINRLICVKAHRKLKCEYVPNISMAKANSCIDFNECSQRNACICFPRLI